MQGLGRRGLEYSENVKYNNDEPGHNQGSGQLLLAEMFEGLWIRSSMLYKSLRCYQSERLKYICRSSEGKV